MVTWNVPFERELIKQSSLFDLPMPHHDSQSCLSQRLNQGTSCVATEDFFNKIDPKPTCRSGVALAYRDVMEGRGVLDRSAALSAIEIIDDHLGNAADLV